MNSLLSNLLKFGLCDISDENELQEMFDKLSESFLYGGYIDAYSRFRIYISAIEFYYHEEDDAPIAKIRNLIKDNIVYHRNNRYGLNVPYFPVMSLNTHQSGIDITFENPEKKYRASALIRAYQVWDNEKKGFIVWHNGGYICVPPEKAVNKQSTYIYNFINGFNLSRGNTHLIWIDSPRPCEGITSKPRIGVKECPTRFWRFERKYLSQTSI